MTEKITMCRRHHVFIFLFFVCFLFIMYRTLRAAEVTVDSTISTTTTTHNGSSPTADFISDQNGYAFYIDSTGACVYSKTINGGTSWETAVTVDSQTDCLGVGVWYDRWTSGNNTGTYIHIVTGCPRMQVSLNLAIKRG
mgnify:CR=1 FL=1